jgi:hypothetical protein
MPGTAEVTKLFRAGEEIEHGMLVQMHPDSPYHVMPCSDKNPVGIAEHSAQRGALVTVRLGPMDTPWQSTLLDRTIVRDISLDSDIVKAISNLKATQRESDILRSLKAGRTIQGYDVHYNTDGTITETLRFYDEPTDFGRSTEMQDINRDLTALYLRMTGKDEE